MPQITIGFALGLIVLGVASYIGSGQASVTALIPAFFGVAMLLCGVVALKQAMRKHAMHAAAALALLGVLGSLGRAIPALDFSQPIRGAVIAQLVMGVALLIFLALCIRSFIAARKSTKPA